MGELVNDLPSLLKLDRLDERRFRGRNADNGERPTLYGGQVAAQCLMAAASTVDDARVPHSFHGYFLRAGRPEIPVTLEVDADRDGGSFSARRVVAVQDGAVIFSMIASFHHERPAAELDAAPHRDVPSPDDAPIGGWNALLEVREVTPTDFTRYVFTDCVWVRSAHPLGDDPLVQRCGLAYVSDLGSGFGQFDRGAVGRGGPSIDHSMWFQDLIRADEWVLLDLRPVKARAARGVYHGTMRDGEGRLGATLCQETLLLPMTAPEPTPA